MSLSAELSCLQGGGGAERDAALVSLEKQLMCPICLEIFSKPVVILPCQHNLCRKCANELYQPSLFQARTTMMVNSGRFRCPSCRHEVVLDRHGVYGLQRNLLVENIIDVYKQEVSSSKSSPSPAPLPPPLPSQETCSDHQGEKVNIYCLSCQVPTCSLCKVFGAHQSCKVAPISDVCQQRKDELNEGITAVATFNNKVQALIDELDQTCKTIEENCKTEKQIVCEKFSRMVSILQERQKAMVQRISHEQDEKTGNILALSRCYGECVEANNKLVESAKSSMEEPDMGVFVQNSREMITKVMSASSSSPYEALKPGSEDLKHYRFTFRRQERALRSIDFLKVVEDVPAEPEAEPEPEKAKDTLIQNHPVHISESVAQPVKGRITSLTSPLEEPATAPPSSSPPPTGRMKDSVEAPEEVMQTEQQESNHVTPALIKEQKQEQEGCAVRDAVKEEITCVQQDGMSTQQNEGGETGLQRKNPAFNPSRYKPAFWDNISLPSPAPELNLPNFNFEEKTVGSPQLDDDTSMKAEAERERETRKQHLDSQFLCGVLHRPEIFLHLQLPLSTILHGQPYRPPPYSSESQSQRPAGKDCVSWEEVQYLVTQPELVEEHLDLGEDDSPQNNQETQLSPSKVEEVAFNEDFPSVEDASACKEKESVDEEGEGGGLGGGSEGEEKSGDDEPVEGLDDATAGEETSASEIPEKVTSCVSLQAVTLVFYLLAFLVILQRVWAYIGCFICT